MHACAVAEELCIPRIVVPNSPGLFSALGLLAADFTDTRVRAVMKPVTAVAIHELERVFDDLQEKGHRILESQGVRPDRMVFLRQVDMRYLGQGYELTVPAPEEMTREELSRVEDRFHSKHESVYGYAARSEPVELVNARLVSIGSVPRPRLREQQPVSDEPPSEALLARRDVYFGKHERHAECPIFARDKLVSGNMIAGPAVVEQYDATTVIYPDWLAHINKIGGIEIRLKK